MNSCERLYRSYISTASKDDLAVLRLDWWERTSGIPLAELESWRDARRKDLDDQEIIRSGREEVVEG
jgi:hypothetical protein